jgi:hypothetical protein
MELQSTKKNTDNNQLGLKKFDVSGYIGQQIRVGRSAKNFFLNFFYCTDSGQNKYVRSLIHKTAVNQCNF